MSTTGSILTSLMKRSNKFSKGKELAEAIGIAPANISNWRNDSEKIPSTRIYQLIDLLEPSLDEIDLLLGNKPLEFHYRTRGNNEVSKKDISSLLRERTRFIYDILLEDYISDIKIDLSKQRKSISNLDVKDKNSYKIIASLFRETFSVSEQGPIILNHVYENILGRILGVKSFYMPFDQILLNNNDDASDPKCAALFRKGDGYAILVDSNRNCASAFFDLLHELIHIFIGQSLSPSSDLEKLIDKVVGELIYPEIYLRDIYTKNKRKISFSLDEIIDLFIEETNKYELTLSPKGLAKALYDYGLIKSKNDLVYKELTTSFFDFFKSHVGTLTKDGHIDINFKSYEEQLKLYANVIDTKKDKYPLFIDLKNRLINNKLSPEDYAKLYGMQIIDAITLKAIWENETPKLSGLSVWKKI